jgi:hypothetical protein
MQDIVVTLVYPWGVSRDSCEAAAKPRKQPFERKTEDSHEVSEEGVTILQGLHTEKTPESYIFQSYSNAPKPGARENREPSARFKGMGWST